MTVLLDYVGQVLDGKYRLERLLGQGGMGAVYLATHLGTERYVALKLITPQFMQNQEFVERFKREARAAGRLRHPNVVDVTDFGFSDTFGETVAYLVMEYLDGCTLADVLSEEHRLKVDWVVDIFEQVCSAVHEAHQQGIIHRDLKPENIWLEPNRLGGYRVKVLDFGIAKLGQASSAEQLPAPSLSLSESSTVILSSSRATHIASGSAAGAAKKTTIENESEPLTSNYFPADGDSVAREAQTRLQIDAESPTLLVDEPVAHNAAQKADQNTLMFEDAHEPHATKTQVDRAELTRVGAIMGTPLYMSPEQCAGKNSDARSDIYSLGVIAYQTLAGEPPFIGDTAKVMREHIDSVPRPLRERAKVPSRVASVIMSALSKDAAERPQTAIAFSNALRANADGIGSLYRRAFSLYSEYFPKFVKLSLIAHIPVIITTLSLISLELALRGQESGPKVTRVLLICGIVLAALLQIVAYFLASASISGMTAVIVTQVSAAPLRPVELRVPFAVLKRRWRPFISTSVRVTLRILLGYACLIIPGMVISIRYALYGPVVLVEGLQKKEAMKRARALASRSWRTVIIVSLLQIAIPLVVSALLGRFSVGPKPAAKTGFTIRTVSQQLSGLINIFIVPLISIVPALLYLKMRQLGGETLSSALSQIEQMDDKGRQWQRRMRSRISLGGPRSRAST